MLYRTKLIHRHTAAKTNAAHIIAGKINKH